MARTTPSSAERRAGATRPGSDTGIGNEALYDVTTGFRNTAIGDSAGLDIGEGNFNTMLGQGAGWGTEHADYNTFVGWSAGGDNNRTNSTTNANRNTYVGVRTGNANREGEDNVGMGAFADFNNTVRQQTTFVGAAANVDNNYVSLFGYSTRSTREYGVAMGYESDVQGTRGTALGANTVVGANANDAVAIGETASVGANGGQSIAIGADAAIADNVSNSIALGSGASVAASNEAYVGNAATTSIGGIVNWTATSDARLKTDVTGDVPGLDFVRRLQPVRYRFDLAGLQALTGERPELADALLAKMSGLADGLSGPGRGRRRRRAGLRVFRRGASERGPHALRPALRRVRRAADAGRSGVGRARLRHRSPRGRVGSAGGRAAAAVGLAARADPGAGRPARTLRNARRTTGDSAGVRDR